MQGLLLPWLWVPVLVGGFSFLISENFLSLIIYPGAGRQLFTSDLFLSLIFILSLIYALPVCCFSFLIFKTSYISSYLSSVYVLVGGFSVAISQDYYLIFFLSYLITYLFADIQLLNKQSFFPSSYLFCASFACLCRDN